MKVKFRPAILISLLARNDRQFQQTLINRVEKREHENWPRALLDNIQTFVAIYFIVVSDFAASKTSLKQPSYDSR